MSDATLADSTYLPAELPKTVRIRAGRSEGQYWKDLYSYREVFLFLAWRDVLVRYRQAVFGIAWAVFRPLLTMVVFTFVFGKLGKFPSDGMPYPLMVFSAILPWLFFSSATLDSSNSLLANQNLVSKVYFPRLHVPLSAVAAAFVDFLFGAIILVAMMFWFSIHPTWRLLTVPVFLGLAILVATGLGIWFSALNVKYRDFRFVLPVLMQLGLYLSPVGFPMKMVPEKWMLLYSMNPMVGVIQGFRWAVFGHADMQWPGFWLSLVLTALLLFTGIRHFRKTERTIADFI